jgi:uncharacterized protein (DUF4415 family)
MTIVTDDFSKGKRGAVIRPDPNKARITISLVSDLIEHFKTQVNEAGGGNYQTLINNALREHVETDKEDLEKRLRKIIREELKKAS